MIKLHMLKISTFEKSKSKYVKDDEKNLKHATANKHPLKEAKKKIVKWDTY